MLAHGLLYDQECAEAVARISVHIVDGLVDEPLSLRLVLIAKKRDQGGVSTLAHQYVLALMPHHESHSLAVGVEGKFTKNFVFLLALSQLILKLHFLLGALF